MIDFNKIVNKLYKKNWKILFKEDIFDIIDPEKKSVFKSFLNKTIYRLKAEKIIMPIRNWVYIILTEDDNSLNEIDLIEKYYLKLLKKFINYYVWNNYFISWQKALEFHIKNFEIPSKFFIVNRDIDKKINVWNFQIIFKTISWNINNKKTNLYSRLSKFRSNFTFENINFKLSCLELSIVETAIVSCNESWIDINLLNKVLKKYSKFLKKDIFEEIGKLKFIMAFNRLKEISRTIDKNLYKLFLDIIKKNWWLFIGEGLRKF